MAEKTSPTRIHDIVADVVARARSGEGAKPAATPAAQEALATEKVAEVRGRMLQFADDLMKATPDPAAPVPGQSLGEKVAALAPTGTGPTPSAAAEDVELANLMDRIGRLGSEQPAPAAVDAGGDATKAAGVPDPASTPSEGAKTLGDGEDPLQDKLLAISAQQQGGAA